MNTFCRRVFVLFFVFAVISGSNSQSECRETNQACGASRGVIKNIGHNVKGKFLKIFHVCYDNNNGEAIYADHIIFGSTIALAKPTIYSRPSFKVGCLTNGVNANSVYEQTSQLSTLTDLLGSAVRAKKYINSNSFMAKGHLAPDADQVSNFKFTTYFYINTVPQWKQINNGNWKSVEYSIRKLATTTAENIKVITGGWEILQLPNTKGTLVNIYLSGKLLPVPKFVWKIAYNLKTKKGIAFVSVNNPFINKGQDVYICPNICNNHNWGTNKWTTTSNGLIYCCKIEELKKKVNTIPNLKVLGILDGPA